MGGRGSRSSIATGGASGISGITVQQPNAGGGGGPSIATQAPDVNNTPVNPGGVTSLSRMSDDQLAALVTQSKAVDMPNHLSDVDDKTQRFVYMAGLNEKPLVVDDAGFANFMQQNGIPQSQVMGRTVTSKPYVVNGTKIYLTPDQINAMTKDSEFNYIGGKWGGMVHGAGTYFDMNGGKPTGYGGSGKGSTMIAVLNPAKAKVINHGQLDSAARRFAQSHPKFASAVGGYSNRTMSIYALAMGYNVIRAGSYNNVIDRSALVIRQRNY